MKNESFLTTVGCDTNVADGTSVCEMSRGSRGRYSGAQRGGGDPDRGFHSRGNADPLVTRANDSHDERFANFQRDFFFQPSICSRVATSHFCKTQDEE